MFLPPVRKKSSRLAPPASSSAFPSLLPRAPAHAVAALRREHGAPLETALRSQFERSLGSDLSHVRIHTDRRAAGAAEGIQANAYTVGQHIAFASGRFEPSTTAGLDLLHHELIHTRQQRGHELPATGAPPLLSPDHPHEQEARNAAFGSFSSAPTKAAGPGIARDGSMRDFARDVRKAVDQSMFFDIISEIGTPQYHRDQLLGYVDHADLEFIRKIVNSLSSRALSDIGGSPQGMEVLHHLFDRLPPGSHERDAVEVTIESRGSGPTALPVTKAKPEDTAAIARINTAVDADPHKADYLKAKIPLRFPVEIYTAGRAVDGGVYYDPNLTEAGQVPISSFRNVVGGKTTPTQYPLLFIKLGSTALDFTDTFIRATLWHEFQHYNMTNQLRGDPAKDAGDVKFLREEADLSTSDSPLDLQEVQASSVELADYGAAMNEAELKSNLLYLGRFLTVALPDFRQAAIDRIVASAKDPKYRQRLVKGIDSIQDKKRKGNLKLLRDALATPTGK